MSHCGLYVAFRPRQTEAGLLLHRHLLSQQHLRVCVLLLPARVTVYSLALLPAKDQGNKVVFLAPSTRKKKKKKRTKASFDCFLRAIQPPVKQPTLPVHFHASETEEMETGCHGYCQSPVVTLFMCNTLSGGTPQRLQKKDPLFLYVLIIVFPVTHCCSVIMCNRFCCNESVFICPIKDCLLNF